MLALGQAIRTMRLKKGLSQKELARLTNITPSFLSQVEGDHRAASLTGRLETMPSLGFLDSLPLWYGYHKDQATSLPH